MILLAPTGVSALNIQGETIHSFFKFRITVTPELAAQQGRRLKSRQFYEKIDCIVIDEVSMLRADLLDCIHAFLAAVLNCDKPFGGKQVLFFGDLYQLPPVIMNHEKEVYYQDYDSPYFFSAKVFEQFQPQCLELEKIYRQQDPDFINCLNALREGYLNPQQQEALNLCVRPNEIDDPDAIYLCSTNAAADIRNSKALANLEGNMHRFEASVNGHMPKGRFPSPEVLTLKRGARVMCLNNDAEQRWVNGSLAEVIAIYEDEQYMVLRLQNGQRVECQAHTWEMYQYRFCEQENKHIQEKIADYTQYPVTLAWAMTIHKSQGKTFDKVIVDLAQGAFAAGQTYVALSRCRSMAGLTLKQKLNANQIKNNIKISIFLKKIKKLNIYC